MQYKTIKLKINSNKTDLEKLHQCNKESAEIWNFCLNKNKEKYNISNMLLSQSDFRNLLKTFNNKIICAFSKDTIAKQLIDAYKSISKARKAGRTDLNYPWKEKKFYPTEWNYQFLFPNYDKNEIKLTTARFIGEDNKPHNGKQIRLKFKTPIPENIQTLKLLFQHGHFYACISYLIDIEEVKSNSNNVSSIDLGEIHSITSIDTKNNQLIITGRKIRSIKQFRNKKYAELTSKIDKCKNGSNQRKKYRKALNKIKSKCRRQLDYSIHKLTRMYTNWAVEKGISTVYIGDITGIELNIDKGTNINQKINQWDYGKIMHYLEYKLNLAGIKLIKVNEAYSSQTCPCCGFRYKPKGRNYICNNCGSEYHRDIVGAWNILHYNVSKLELPSNNIKYLRIS